MTKTSKNSGGATRNTFSHTCGEGDRQQETGRPLEEREEEGGATNKDSFCAQSHKKREYTCGIHAGGAQEVYGRTLQAPPTLVVSMGGRLFYQGAFLPVCPPVQPNSVRIGRSTPTYSGTEILQK